MELYKFMNKNKKIKKKIFEFQTQMKNETGFDLKLLQEIKRVDTEKW